MNTKYTPAPWNKDLEAIKDVMGRFRIQVYRKGLECIAIISGKNKKEVEANAKLIAAAPELLEACISMEKNYREMAHAIGEEGLLPEDTSYQLIVSAIKKATE